MAKSRIGVVVRESLGGNKSTSRSADLHKLYQNYQVWCKQIAALLEALKGHQQALLHIEKTRKGVSLVVIVVVGCRCLLEPTWNDYTIPVVCLSAADIYFGLGNSHLVCLFPPQ